MAALLANRHAIAVNQAWAGTGGSTFPLQNVTSTVTLEDAGGGGGKRRRTDEADTVPTLQAWYKPLPNGGAAIFIANHGGSEQSPVTIDFARDVPGLGPPAPPAHCDAKAFEDLGDTQCMGLRGPAPTVNSSGACCAACRCGPLAQQQLVMWFRHSRPDQDLG